MSTSDFVIKADINGVKLINEAFGHDEGDRVIIETAKILEKCCRKGDILARTGGDEFSIFMPNTSNKEADEFVKYIKEKCVKYNKKISNSEEYINISIGFATKNNEDESLDKT
jgi:diguanylate cyclase (GGDEF)-like protein